VRLRNAVRDGRAITHNLELCYHIIFNNIDRDVQSRRTTASVVLTHLYTRIVYVNYDRLLGLNGGGMGRLSVIKSGRRDGESVGLGCRTYNIYYYLREPINRVNIILLLPNNRT